MKYILKCKVCDKTFSSDKNGKFCSRPCYYKFIKGKIHPNRLLKISRKEAHWNWKGGISPLRVMIYNSSEYSDWKLNIFIRDRRTCQKCGYKGKKLEAHHIKPFCHIFQEFLKTYNQFSPLEDKETLTRLAMKYKPFWDVDNGITFCKDCHEITKKIYVRRSHAR